MCRDIRTVLGMWIAVLAVATPLAAQPQRPPEVTSPEVSAERNVTFRLLAPKANEVRLIGGDLPGVQNNALSRAEQGIWEITVGPVPAGAYRYQFSVDGAVVLDARNTATSESNSNNWSLVHVPGSETADTADVPHGAVAQVTYFSKSLNRSRRMHVYTPPGYEKGDATYPVLYLLHGALDCDASWSTVGRAGFILDNLIAARKARPMVVVMPNGHTAPFRFGPDGDRSFDRQMEEFEADFVNDLRPHVEARYRISGQRAGRAIAGLSMGGAQTLNIAFAKLDDYAYVGVYSSGIFGIAGGFGGRPPSTQWEDSHRDALDNRALKDGLKLVWFGCGKDDFLVKTSDATVKMLRGHDIDVTYKENDGGHTWINWREYLADFAPLLFQEKAP